jgi:protein-L-isoaspartate(D-aspartate) O-methyltransferase
MRKVDRGDFCEVSTAYQDSPQPIGYNATISAPHMHAFCLEWLIDVLKPGHKVLDVGSGSGYLCATFYEMMDRQGTVVGVDHIEGLVQDSINNLNKHYSQQLKDDSIIMKCGDGRLGCSELAPYNAIHVGAGTY